MSTLLSTNRDVDKTKKKLVDFFDAAEKVKSLKGSQILEIPNESVCWLISPEGERLRKVCGHKSNRGPCLLPAGWNTEHLGFGRCSFHSRSLLYNEHLSRIHGLPARFGELLQFADDLEDTAMLNVDHEIKFMTALRDYLLTIEENGVLTMDQIDRLHEHTMNIVKAKAIKNKIQKEMRLDVSTIKEFISQVFTIISQHVPTSQSQRIFRDVVNRVLVPFKNTDKFSGGQADFSRLLDKADIEHEDKNP